MTARWAALAAALSIVGCAGDASPEPTTPEAPALDLYVVPSTVVDPSLPRAGWPFKASAVTLSEARADAVEVPIADGGTTQGRVVRLQVSEDGLSVDELPVVARVVAWGADGLPWVGTVEGDAFSHEFALRAPAGLYDLRIEPYDRSLIPQWQRDVALPMASDLVVVIEEGIQVRGTVTDGDAEAPQPLAGVQVVPRDPITGARSGSVSTTSDAGNFAVRVPAGQHAFWVRRDVIGGAAAPIPATRAAVLTVDPDALSPLALTVSPPETTTLVGEVKYIDRFVDGAVVTASREGELDPAGSIEVSFVTGTGSAPNPGSFALSLPDGSYTVTVEPPAGGADALAPLTWQGGAPLTVPTAGDPLEIALDPYLVGLQGELLKAGTTAAARGTSLLFIPDEPLRPVLSTLARGQLATFSVGISPPGGSPIALGPGAHDVVMIPPTGATTGRQTDDFNLTLGQTQLTLAALPETYRLYGRLTGDDVASFEHAVIKATVAGVADYDLRWGPGPDPRDVVAEAIVEADGSFTLRVSLP